ncbi:MAG: 30S ribosomal protein S19e [Nitrososphaerota archaeon]
MPTVYDVPPSKLIEHLSNYLKRIPQIQPPQWSYYVKSGSHTSRPPTNRDWWYLRSASILRKLYLHAPLGIGDLEIAYGGRKKSGYGLAHERPAGSSSIRKCLAQLQAAGFVQKTPKGRALTPEGRRLCDRISTEVFREIAKTQQDLLKIVT